MSFLSLFTQGGQTQIHQFRMLRQVIWTTLSVAFFLSLCVGAWQMNAHLPTGVMRWIHASYLAEFKLSMPFVKPERAEQNWYGENGKVVEVKSVDILRNPLSKRAQRTFRVAFDKGVSAALMTFMTSLLILCTLWIVKGRANKRKKLLSGVEVVSVKVLKKLIKRKKQASQFVLGGVPLIKDAETKHMLICGTTGSGKTNCLHELLPQIRKQGQRAVIVDLTGDFVAKYYREGQDILLNPFDGRSKGWSPWDECWQEYHYDDLAAAIIPSSSYDPFWYTAARVLFAEGMKQFKETPSLKKLLKFLLTMPLSTAERILSETRAATLLSKENDKTAASIRSTLSNAIRSFEYVNDQENVFSLRLWVREAEASESWVFLSSAPDQRETLKPLLNAWLSTALSSLLSLHQADRRLWFIIDELHAIDMVPVLPQALAEARKYGGCFVLGTQDFNQLDKVYGASLTNSMLGLLNTKIIFRSPDDQTARRLSATFGEQEQSQIVEGLSFGAHHMRDGVNLSDQRRIRPVVSLTEIIALKDLEAFIKLPGNFPPAKLKFQYQKR